MLCQICKVNQATVRYTEIMSNSVTEIHLCQKCAQSEGEGIGGDFGLAGLLGVAEEQAEVSTTLEGDAAQACRCCGHSFKDIVSAGRVGCAECYTTFRDQLAHLIEKVHNASQHLGKIPSGKDDALRVRSELLRHRSQLQKAVEEENYEEAARIRDVIREIEEGMVKG